MDISNLTIGSNAKSSNSSLMAEIDKHIEIKFLKEGRRNKTYIYGLGDYVEGGEKELKKCIEKLQKKLGTSVLEEEKDNKKYYGFGGDHVNTLKTFVLNDLKVPKDKVKT
jgi:hypothetical protein